MQEASVLLVHAMAADGSTRSTYFGVPVHNTILSLKTKLPDS